MNGDLEEMIGLASRETLREDALRSRWLALGGRPLVREGLSLAAKGEVTHADILAHDRQAMILQKTET